MANISPELEKLAQLSEFATSRNPATGDVIETFKLSEPMELEAAALAADQAFLSWKRVPITERTAKLKKLSAVLSAGAERFATLITSEMGKTHKEAVAEVNKCALCCDYYAEHAATFLQDQAIALPNNVKNMEAWTTYQPLGVVLAVMPWNFPFWQVFRCAIPTTTAGNTVILKHASNVSRCALEIERIFRTAGYPEHVFQTVLASRDQIPDLIKHPAIKAVSLTGSVEAGRQVAQAAGGALKKVVLELGGSDPYVILADADIDLAASRCAESRLLNAGQSCISAKRFIVVESVSDRFIQKFSAAMSAKKYGAPEDPHSDLGPMAREDLRDTLQRQVAESVTKGAMCLIGGKIPEGKGYFYPPTILTHVTKGMPAYSEEFFGPVASVIIAKDTKDALRIANDTEFGLGGAIFTKDLVEGKRLIREELDSGFCALNDYVRSDPVLPFGGIKSSGYGRELSDVGIKEFVNIKTLKITSS